MATFPRKRTRHCGHCDQDVSHRVYKRHKEQYYDFNNRTWTQRKQRQFDDDHNEVVLNDVIGAGSSAGEHSDSLCMNQ